MLNKMNRFESIGDNCEFAFYLRSLGVDDGSLFRWTLIQNYQSLLTLLESGFEDLFSFENLKPSWQDMVVDSKYNICFHTKMYSDNLDGKWIWSKQEKERRDIYLIEKNKINYLIEKFKKSLSNQEKIFVLKNNENNLDEFAIKLSEKISCFGDAKILYVKSDGNNSGECVLEEISNNLYFSYIDRFAEYSNADNFSKLGWDKVIEQSLLKL